jgi:hypothetical protein
MRGNRAAIEILAKKGLSKLLKKYRFCHPEELKATKDLIDNNVWFAFI